VGAGKRGSRRTHWLKPLLTASHKGASRLGAREGPRVTTLHSLQAV